MGFNGPPFSRKAKALYVLGCEATIGIRAQAALRIVNDSADPFYETAGASHIPYLAWLTCFPVVFWTLSWLVQHIVQNRRAQCGWIPHGFASASFHLWQAICSTVVAPQPNDPNLADVSINAVAVEPILGQGLADRASWLMETLYLR